MKEIIEIKGASFSNQTVNSTFKSIGRQKVVSEKKKNNLTSIQLQTIQDVAEGKTKFRNPNTPRQDKIKRRVQNFSKIWEKSCSCNNWRQPCEPRSLDNFFLKQQTV